jgi:hypothetical protein
MTVQEISNAPVDKYSVKEWKPLIDFFWDRYNKRYFDPIKILQKNSNKDIRNNCGFLVATIDCILIETLEQYYSGKDESEGSSHEPFYNFFKRSDAFKIVIKDEKDAGKFAGLIRSGLLHQSKTKKASIINKKATTPILDWVDNKEKNKGFKLNRDKFHNAVFNEYKLLVGKIKEDGNSELRKKFKSKLTTLVE